MFRKALTTAGALLVGFHVWVLAGQAWDGQLVDAGLLGRWLIAGGLVWALARLRRQGVSMFWGRKAVAIWLLAALLHGPSVAERFGGADLVAVPEVAATVAQIGLGGAVVLGVFLLLAALGAPRRRRASLAARIVADPTPSGALPPGFSFLVAPRPPPVV